MAKPITILVLSLLCLTLLIQTAEATGKRRRGNKCARVGLSLSETTADLLAGKKRIDIGSVSLSTKHGKLITKIKTIHGCTLSDVRIDIFPGNSLGHASPATFPCKKKVRHAKSAVVSCPIKKFPRIVDCCAEHFVAAVYAIVNCRGVHHLSRRESAYAGGPACTKRHGIPCSYVPIKLVPGCKGKGCKRNAPFVEVCKHSKCVKVVQKPCSGKRCEDDFTPSVNKCVEGTCVYVPQKACDGKSCKHNAPVVSKCVNGWCKKVRQPPCKGRTCDDHTPLVNTCSEGKCVYKVEEPCKGRKCDDHTPFVNTCWEGKCIYKAEEPCKGRKCDDHTPLVNTCWEGNCIYKPEEPCKGRKCDDHTPLVNTCWEGKCLYKPEEPCKGRKCDDHTPLVNTCWEGNCIYKPEEPCKGRKCDDHTPMVNTCWEGKCIYKEQEPCKGHCHGLIPLSSVCKDGECEDTKLSPCEDKCEDNVPQEASCVGGKCLFEPLPPCKDTCDGNKKVFEKCERGKCLRKVVKCGKCEVCKVTGLAHPSLTCEKLTCNDDERLDEKKCRCCPICVHPYIVTPDGCGCKKH